jgi:coenzyme F420-reducing hydrogenase beta subunit
MTEDKNGFLYPIINADACIACGLCEKACPVMTPLKTGENEPKAYAANSTDEKMRLVSSSGGVFTEIAKAILAHGGAVFGAAYGERYEVVHIRVDTEEDLAKLRGAKYAQSDLRGVLRM